MKGWRPILGLGIVGMVIGMAGATGALQLFGASSTAPQPAAQSQVVDFRAPGAGSLGIAEGAGASPTPVATDTPAPIPPQSLLATQQIVGYYGHPLSALLGTLGDGEPAAMLDRLQQQAAAFQAVNTEKTVVPALHLIYEVAQQFTADDGLYLYRTDDATVRQFIQLTKERHMLLFLDLQIGRSSLTAELNYVLPYLQEPNVQLAIDPEFAMPPGEKPGDDIGSLDCVEINTTLDRIEQLVEEQHLPNKIVVIHQFQDTMLVNKDQLRFDEARVDTVLMMDGFGPQAGKLAKYDSLVTQYGAKHGGIKLFYKYDIDLLSPQQIDDLSPRPDYIVFQ